MAAKNSVSFDVNNKLGNKTFTAEEVLKSATNVFNGDELAGSVFLKYALQDHNGMYHESVPADMHNRLTNEFHRIELNYANPLSRDFIYNKLSTWEWVPQGSPMSAIGNPFQIQSLSNCFVIPDTLDCYSGICLTDQQQLQIMKRRGGVGNDISGIRPKGFATSNSAKTTDGIGVFMERFSNSTREVAQNGRRGARMITISVHHPEIKTFIQIKKDLQKVTGANISIRVTDEFMKAVKDDIDYEQRFPVEDDKPRISSKMVNAKEIFALISECAWEVAEPGLLFWDLVLKESPADCYADVGYKTISTNPCGELPLSALDSCRLLLITLTRFVNDPYTKKAKFNFEAHKESVIGAQRLMDDLVDLEIEAIDKIIAKVESDKEPDDVKAVELSLWKNIRNACANGRRTGLGITGLGDVIAMLGHKYGSDESIELTEKIYKNQAIAAYESTIQMAKERGSFPVFNFIKEADHPFLKRVDVYSNDDYKKYGRRNISLLTTSPAGSTSCLTQTTSGEEPAIFLDYKRRKKVNSADPSIKVDFTDKLGDTWQEYIVKHHGHQTWCDMYPDLPITDSPYFGATAEDVEPVDKIKIQAAAQKWVDHAISNTINFKKDVPKEKIQEVYFKAWEMGCKGITVYREGSRSGVMVKEDVTELSKTAIVETHAPKRPEKLECELHRSKIKGEEYLILIGLLDGKPYEVFAGLAENIEVGKTNNKGILTKRHKKYDLAVGDEIHLDIVSLFDNPNYGSFTRILSTSLRHGIPIKYLVDQLRKDKHSDLFSFSAVLARIFGKNYLSDGIKTGKICPECNSTNVVYIQGCPNCLDCGNSKCG